MNKNANLVEIYYLQITAQLAVGSLSDTKYNNSRLLDVYE